MTKNFKKSEFDCKCGCNMPDDVLANITKLASQLQYIRDNVAMPITINSGYRCEAHNSSDAVTGEILQGGLGMYQTFTHYDIRSNIKARWNNA